MGRDKNTKGFLKNILKPTVFPKIYSCITKISMELQNNDRDCIPIRYTMPPNKISSTKVHYVLLSHWPRGCPMESSTIIGGC